MGGTKRCLRKAVFHHLRQHLDAKDWLDKAGWLCNAERVHTTSETAIFTSMIEKMKIHVS